MFLKTCFYVFYITLFKKKQKKKCNTICNNIFYGIFLSQVARENKNFAENTNHPATNKRVS